VTQGTESAYRVADVLVTAFSGPPLGASEISRRLNLSKTVVHRILKSLTARELLAFNPSTRKYEPGPASLIIGSRSLNHHGLHLAARRPLHDLQNLTGETVTLSALVGMTRIYIDHNPGSREPRALLDTSSVYPLYAGSSSKVILAFADAMLKEHVLTGYRPRITPGTVTDSLTLSRELQQIASVGVATSRGERQRGVASVAGAVFGLDGQVVGAVSVCGPLPRFDEPTILRYRQLVSRCAHLVTRALRVGRSGVPIAGLGMFPPGSLR